MTERPLGTDPARYRMDRVRLELPGGSFHALAGAGERPLVFLHGFPDHPPTAQPLFAELAERGHRVLAPWLRGYAPSPLAGPYDVPRLVDDVLAIIDRWSPGRPVDLVGHDWGAAIAYVACITAPDRIARAVTLALPHPLTFARALRTTRAQALASWYMLAFQIPGSGWLARARDLAWIDLLWRRWSPGYTLPHARRAELHACLAASLPAPIRYYRAAMRGSRALIRACAQPIRTPLLALHGADDGCVLPPTFDDRRRFAGPYERDQIAGVGHFLHLEQPAAVAARISGWLRR